MAQTLFVHWLALHYIFGTGALSWGKTDPIGSEIVKKGGQNDLLQQQKWIKKTITMEKQGKKISDEEMHRKRIKKLVNFN